jgi:hypothetical protein
VDVECGGSEHGCGHPRRVGAHLLLAGHRGAPQRRTEGCNVSRRGRGVRLGWISVESIDCRPRVEGVKPCRRWWRAVMQHNWRREKLARLLMSH